MDQLSFNVHVLYPKRIVLTSISETYIGILVSGSVNLDNNIEMKSQSI